MRRGFDRSAIHTSICMELHFGMGWTRFNYSKSGLLPMEGTGSQKMNVLPWEASDRREMLIVGAVDFPEETYRTIIGELA